MKKIKITQGKYALVDDKDFEMLSRHNWHFHTTGYARTSTPKKCYMHRMILRADSSKQCDHINGNRLDNRRSNLRLCAERENHFNLRIRVDNQSGYRGVSFDKRRKKWLVQITVSGVHKHIGRFKDKMEAVRNYNLFAKDLYGDFSGLNEV